MRLRTHRLGTLQLREPPAPGRPAHVGAASGLVAAGGTLYVVADDEHHLGVFPASGTQPGRLLRLFPGDLPDAHAERKAHKPDLEALVLLPPFAAHPHGALMALGSGSRDNRRRGAVLALDAQGHATDLPRVLDLGGLYATLDGAYPALNIEGAAVVQDRLVLLQRGSRGHPDNAAIEFALPPILDALARGDALGEHAPLEHRRYALGDIDGVALCFTDAAPLPNDGLLFSAVAEDAPDTYRDGACLGAAVGAIDRHGTLRFLRRLDVDAKVEGLHAHCEGDRIRLLMVTDADDAQVPAMLLSAEFEADELR